MLNRRTLTTIALMASAFAGGPAFAQGQAIVGIQSTTTYSIDGRITAVDPAARTVTLTSADGAARPYTVSPAVANFASTRVGDTVSLIVQDTRTFVLSGPRTRTPTPRDTTIAAAASSGQGAAGAAVSKSITNWWVTAVNPAANTITLVSPNSGPVRTFNVADPAGQQQLPRVKAGDSLTDTSTASSSWSRSRPRHDAAPPAATGAEPVVGLQLCICAVTRRSGALVIYRPRA